MEGTEIRIKQGKKENQGMNGGKSKKMKKKNRWKKTDKRQRNDSM